MEVKRLSSSALGDNTLYYINMQGRVLIDLLKVVQRDHNLVSYKLDYVADNFIIDKILDIVETNEDTNTTTMKIKGQTTLKPGNFITITYTSKLPTKDYLETKYKIKDWIKGSVGDVENRPRHIHFIDDDGNGFTLVDFCCVSKINDYVNYNEGRYISFLG